MLPKLGIEQQIPIVVKQFLGALQANGFGGEIDTSTGTRLVHAVDNSAYQVMPQVVLFPKLQDDLTRIFQVAKRPEFHSLHFTAKGGGVTTNGQCLTNGIVIDCSKYLNHILQLNLKEGWVRVEPGVVLDQLQAFLKPHGYFFPITISPSNRCTLGGMANTNACGQGSMFYGRMSDHILSLHLTFTDASTFESRAVDVKELDELKARQDVVGEIYRQIEQTVTRHEADIIKLCPDLPRTVTGYNLGQVVLDKKIGFNPASRIGKGVATSSNRVFDLNRIVSGSEGTLALISALTLRITKMPKIRHLVVIQYSSFQRGLEDALILNAAKPESIETVDGVILDLAKTDLAYPFVSQYVETAGAKVDGITLIQFIGDTAAAVEKQVKQLQKLLKAHPLDQRIAQHVVTDAAEIGHLWHLRKSSVGLLGKTKGRRKPTSGMEDTMVPPARLADYIKDFRGLLDAVGVKYGMFGHVDAGCMHVRPKLDLSNPDDEALYHTLSAKVAKLAEKYGGIMWGEHGKGFRCEYVPDVFGATLFQELCKIKKAFDPYDQLNRGKIAVTSGDAKDLIASGQPGKRGHFDRQVKADLRERYDRAMSCNGNGACFNYDAYDQMCPSYKVTRDRRHSPKGRATLVREWLRLRSVPPVKTSGAYDYSKEVYEALAGCLGCKACATQCPVNINVPSFKSQFLEAYHTRYMRSLRDRAIGNTERLAAWQNVLPRLSNVLQRRAVSRWLMKHLFKLVDAPLLSTPTLNQLCRRHHIKQYRLHELPQQASDKDVVLLQDWVTRFYEADLVVACHQLLTKLGFNVYLLQWFPNGKPLHVKGYLKRFRALARRNARRLAAIQNRGFPIVGVDPSITLTYRNEYADEQFALPAPVYLIQEWLAQHNLKPCKLKPTKTKTAATLLMHCTEKTHDVNLTNAWQNIFKQLGVKVSVGQTGCCGMAGTYGHELEQQTNSRRLLDMSWQSYLDGEAPVLASGYSCRSQVKRLQHQDLLHPVEYLLQQMGK